MRKYYGLVGNGETAALIGPDLAVAWLCAPRFDKTPVFASALDPVRGGFLGLSLADEAGNAIPLEAHTQQYLGDSAILRTVAGGCGWRVEAVDYMPWGEHALVREIHLTNTTADEAVAMVKPVPVPVQSVAFPVGMWEEPGLVGLSFNDGILLVTVPHGRPGRVPAGATVTVRIVLAYGNTDADARGALARAASATCDAEAAFWQGWMAQAAKPASPDWAAAYRRSLIVMKLLSYEPTGALLAAPTASFPAVPGGHDNWDYRYPWLRDGYYTAISFDAAGLHTEARRFYDFVFSLQEADGHWRQPLYTVDGGDPQEFIAPDLAGPNGEKPLRFGNAASGQLQLDNEGNIIHGLWFHYKASGDRSALLQHWDGVVKACTWTAANWARMESGIWELRSYQAHWVHGKAMCYAALEAGARIADVLGHTAEAEAWRTVAATIHKEVVELGWNEPRQAYLRHYGEGTPAPCVDISVLALVFYGLLPADDPRILSTVRLMEQDQSQGGLALYEGICRYDYAAVPFYLPTMWLARYYLMAGRTDDARRLMQVCRECATDLGLMAEHFDGRDRSQWGNFPQAFSHEELARLTLELAQGWSFHKWDIKEAGTSTQRT
ncbi:MAG TPA: glycoside hydrolase family 15 protein [Symbiobacteriaceae bacterium]|nr:glycoside hydrolase family 15 protein [Symbiobacteriaceae bacterium]